jgi:hypothetical protein
MTEFEKMVTNYIQGDFPKGSKNWNDYESAKYLCLFNFSPTDEQYPVMLKIITDWLEL